MILLRTRLAAVIAFAILAILPPAHAGIGADVAAHLTALYYYTPKHCGGPDRPAFLCSGILIRATMPSTAYVFYSISPKAQAKGGVSMSYLRKDAKFQNLAFGMTSGFIFDEIRPDQPDPLRVMCAYPIDGATDRRKNGCDDYNRTAAIEQPCHLAGIHTAEQWIARLRATTDDDEPRRRGAQCSFDMRGHQQPETAAAFHQMIRATRLLPEELFQGGNFQENEIVVAPWRVDAPRSPAILAAFHLDTAGPEGARLSQIQWFQATGQFLPIITVSLPRAPTQEARFTYRGRHQALYEPRQPDACERFVAQAHWAWRHDEGFGKPIASLEVVPTDCGRRIQDEQTGNFMNELIAGYYLQPEWVDNRDNTTDRFNAMRRQLVCHLVTGRDRASWSLEPSRPYVTHAESLARACDPR